MTQESHLSEDDGNIGIVLLAAGASRRMGSPKQLIALGGVSLIRRSAEHALDSGCRPTVVVLGSNADRIAPELNGLALNITVNRQWATGMASSIRCGLKALLAIDSHVRGVVLFLGDQPNVTGSSLRRLNRAHMQSGSGLIAASYSGCVGTPALFSRAYFPELLQIDGQGGAKNLLGRHARRIFPIDFPEAACDLDTPRDLANLSGTTRSEDRNSSRQEGPRPAETSRSWVGIQTLNPTVR